MMLGSIAYAQQPAAAPAPPAPPPYGPAVTIDQAKKAVAAALAEAKKSPYPDAGIDSLNWRHSAHG